MKNLNIVLLLLLSLMILGLDAATQSISAWPAFSTVQADGSDVGLFEDISADSTGDYYSFTLSSMSSFVLGSATIGGTSSGDIVTIDDTQTLTNKTLTSPDINSPDIDGGTFDGGTAGTNSPLTEVQIDNLNFDGTEISSSADIDLTPTGYVDIPSGDLKYAGTAVTATGAEINLLDAGSSEAVYDGGSNVTFKAGSAVQMYLVDGTLRPAADDDVDGGTSSVRFRNWYLDGVLYTDDITFRDTVITASTASINYLEGVKSQVAGINERLAMNTYTISSNYTIQNSGLYIIDSSSNTVLLTLAALSRTEQLKVIIVIQSGGNNVSIVANGSDAGFVLNGTLHDEGGLSNTAKHCVILESCGYPTGYWFITGYYGFAWD